MYEFIEDNKTTLLFLLLLLLGIASFLSNKNKVKKRKRVSQQNNKYRSPIYVKQTLPKNNDISKEDILNIINKQQTSSPPPPTSPSSPPPPTSPSSPPTKTSTNNGFDRILQLINLKMHPEERTHTINNIDISQNTQSFKTGCSPNDEYMKGFDGNTVQSVKQNEYDDNDNLNISNNNFEII